MTSDGPMTTRIPPILRLVFAACTVGLFGELPKADEPPAGSLHTADLLARCLAIEPARPAFAKEAMVPYVARLLAGRDLDRAVAGWRSAAEEANQTAIPKAPSTIPDPFNKHALVHAWMLCRGSSHLPADSAATIAAATKEYVCRYGHHAQ